MQKKKVVILFLVFVLILSALFVGCTETSGSDSSGLSRYISREEKYMYDTDRYIIKVKNISNIDLKVYVAARQKNVRLIDETIKLGVGESKTVIFTFGIGQYAVGVDSDGKILPVYYIIRDANDQLLASNLIAV